MEKKQGSSSSKSSGPQRPSQRKMIGAKAMRINEDEGARLVGSIVEKGISGKPPAPSSAPQPTVLPFPVARHRSHGPVSFLSLFFSDSCYGPSLARL